MNTLEGVATPAAIIAGDAILLFHFVIIASFHSTLVPHYADNAEPAQCFVQKDAKFVSTETRTMAFAHALTP